MAWLHVSFRKQREIVKRGHGNVDICLVSPKMVVELVTWQETYLAGSAMHDLFLGI